jgi:hypothetical protein
MTAHQTGTQAAGDGQRVRVCYLTRGHDTTRGKFEYRTYPDRETALAEARAALANGLPAERGYGGMARVDEAHLQLTADLDWEPVR